MGRLLDALPHGAEAWAQVRDPDAATIARLYDEVGVDRIEVHGTVPEGLAFLQIHHLVPALPIPPPGPGGPVPPVPPAEDFPMLALETGGAGPGHGHPDRSDWQICQDLVDRNPGRKLVLSGGINAENVGDALAQVHPWGIGVGAALESAPGRIDPARMAAFLEALAAAEKATGA